MGFEWDDAKNDDCFLRRGFDFTFAAYAFRDPNRIVERDGRWDYGEDRYRLLGAIGDRVFVLIYTLRGPAIRIISARKAKKKEVRKYGHDAHQD